MPKDTGIDDETLLIIGIIVLLLWLSSSEEVQAAPVGTTGTMPTPPSKAIPIITGLAATAAKLASSLIPKGLPGAAIAPTTITAPQFPETRLTETQPTFPLPAVQPGLLVPGVPLTIVPGFEVAAAALPATKPPPKEVVTSKLTSEFDPGYTGVLVASVGAEAAAIIAAAAAEAAAAAAAAAALTSSTITLLGAAETLVQAPIYVLPGIITTPISAVVPAVVPAAAAPAAASTVVTPAASAGLSSVAAVTIIAAAFVGFQLLMNFIARGPSAEEYSAQMRAWGMKDPLAFDIYYTQQKINELEAKLSGIGGYQILTATQIAKIETGIATYEAKLAEYRTQYIAAHGK